MSSGIRKGLSFGLTSGVITTLGLLVGLHSGTGSRVAVLGGIVTIALADSLSDALGIHVSEEATAASHRQIWLSTLATFGTKFVVSSSFVPFLIVLDLDTAVTAAVIWGAVLLTLLSWAVARSQGSHPLPAIVEHLVIGAVVVFISGWLGDFVAAHVAEADSVAELVELPGG